MKKIQIQPDIFLTEMFENISTGFWINHHHEDIHKEIFQMSHILLRKKDIVKFHKYIWIQIVYKMYIIIGRELLYVNMNINALQLVF